MQKDQIAQLISEHGREIGVFAVRQTIDKSRKDSLLREAAVDQKRLLMEIKSLVTAITGKSLKSVTNATGVVLHTNLGRAPLGQAIMDEALEILKGYSNLEFDLNSGKRGQRVSHIVELIKYLTMTEDAVVVNNNAAGIILALNTLARGKEVIISRGELIEIGGSFRIPEIMRAAGVRMVEVGTTNKTHLADYDQAITEKTALILKAHKSNYVIKGFSAEVGINDLSKLARDKGLTLIYDIGSGLLRRPQNIDMKDEPDIRTALQEGADLVTFSCDKLLGGPQGGIVAGRKDLIARLAKAPMMRALRVGKLTMAVLAAACRNYLNDQDLIRGNPLFAMLKRSEAELKAVAGDLANELRKKDIKCEVVANTAQCGGGSLPDLELPSFAVLVKAEGKTKAERVRKAENMYYQLLKAENPVVGILRKGELLFDVFTLFEKDVSLILSSIS
jgi:L-seryl-tRNA(Ser) seleniumtransferase